MCALALGGRRVRRRGTWRTRGTRERHQRIEPRRERRPDPFDASQVRQRAKWPTLFAVGDDPPRHHRPDTRQRVQLRRRRDIDVDPRARQHRAGLVVRRPRRSGGIEAGQTVRDHATTAASRSRLTLPLPLLRFARGIDGRQLAVQRARVCRGNGVDGSHGPQRADRCAEEADAGEEEERFFFGGSWHAPRIAGRTRIRLIRSLHAVPKAFEWEASARPSSNVRKFRLLQ